jgi:dolichol-phosphate mannosyltransferase
LRTLVIIPTYQEVENVDDVLRRVRAAAPHADVLVVDDSSPDGTADAARATGAEVGGVDVLVRPGKEGLGNAYRAGFARAFERGYEVVVQMDADLSHDPAALPGLLARLDEGADLVIGSRYVPGGRIPAWPWWRRMLSRWGNHYAAAVLGVRIHDCTAGFRAWRAPVLAAVEADPTRATGYGFLVELAYRVHRLGATVVEVPITFNDRVRGTSKMSWLIVVETMSLVTWWGLRDRLGRGRGRRGEAQAVPNSLSPASPSPGTMNARSSSRSSTAAVTTRSTNPDSSM